VTIEFLDVDDVVLLHDAILARYGGTSGIRDRGLLCSAVEQPQARFAGTYLHVTVVDMAAAYLFHIVSNHAFVDGNKRTGLLTALVFLERNGYRVREQQTELFELTMAVSRSELSKHEIAETLQGIVEER
jgi:death-on-curing protein